MKHSFKNKSDDCDPKYNFDLKMDNRYNKNDSQELNGSILPNHSSLSEYFNTIENDTIEEIQIPHLQSLNPPQTAHVFVNLSTDKYNSKLNVKYTHEHYIYKRKILGLQVTPPQVKPDFKIASCYQLTCGH